MGGRCTKPNKNVRESKLPDNSKPVSKSSSAISKQKAFEPSIEPSKSSIIEKQNSDKPADLLVDYKNQVEQLQKQLKNERDDLERMSQLIEQQKLEIQTCQVQMNSQLRQTNQNDIKKLQDELKEANELLNRQREKHEHDINQLSTVNQNNEAYQELTQLRRQMEMDAQEFEEKRANLEKEKNLLSQAIMNADLERKKMKNMTADLQRQLSKQKNHQNKSQDFQQENYQSQLNQPISCSQLISSLQIGKSLSLWQHSTAKNIANCCQSIRHPQTISSDYTDLNAAIYPMCIACGCQTESHSRHRCIICLRMNLSDAPILM